MPNRTKAVHGCLSDIDRLSDLPDYILHHIISFLDTQEACRTTILSKRWVNIWSTGFILDFNPCFFKSRRRLVSFIETTMQRYSNQNLSIRKLELTYPKVDKEMTGRVDRWLQIAVINQVEDLSLNIPETKSSDNLPSYRLPMILFSAKSLIHLDLFNVDIDEHMLHHLITSCPLKTLRLDQCTGITNLAIPNRSELEWVDVGETVPSGGSIKVETPNIQHFSYCGFDGLDPWWPFNFSLASKKHLSNLDLTSINILVNVVDKLVTELSSIKIMSFNDSTMPNSIRIASLTLDELVINNCYDLVNLTLDTPQLKTFLYTGGDLQLSSVTSRHSICNAALNLIEGELDAQSLVTLNRVLSRSKCFKVLSIDLIDVQIKIDMDEVIKIDAGPPYEIEELKLLETMFRFQKVYSNSSVRWLVLEFPSAVLSLSFFYPDKRETIIKLLLKTMEEKVKCMKHPLKRIEIESTDYSAIDTNLDSFGKRVHFF